MPKKNAHSKLKALIRKVVQEELNKALKTNDPRHAHASHDTFDLDPRFSTGHYTRDNDPFPHNEELSGTKRQSKRQTDKETSEHAVPEFEPFPGGAFGPPPNPPEQPRSGQTMARPPFEGGFPPPFPPPHPGFSGPPPHTGKQKPRDQN